jgi:hypothetical protein
MAAVDRTVETALIVEEKIELVLQSAELNQLKPEHSALFDSDFLAGAMYGGTAKPVSGPAVHSHVPPTPTLDEASQNDAIPKYDWTAGASWNSVIVMR